MALHHLFHSLGIGHASAGMASGEDDYPPPPSLLSMTGAQMRFARLGALDVSSVGGVAMGFIAARGFGPINNKVFFYNGTYVVGVKTATLSDAGGGFKQGTVVINPATGKVISWGVADASVYNGDVFAYLYNIASKFADAVMPSDYAAAASAANGGVSPTYVSGGAPTHSGTSSSSSASTSSAQQQAQQDGSSADPTSGAQPPIHAGNGSSSSSKKTLIAGGLAAAALAVVLAKAHS